jgi:phosphoglycerate dehydrogenase-like enzyme
MDKMHLHIKNNRAGEEVFSMSPERVAAALTRRPDIAERLDVTVDWDTDNFTASMAQAEGLLTWNLPKENLSRVAPKLKWIHIIGAGVEHLQPLDWLPRGVTLVNNRGVHAAKVADYGVMAILMLNNRMPAYYEAQRNRRFDPQFATPVTGKTLAVIGVGEMGGAVARAAKRFGLHVIGVRRGGRKTRSVHEMFGPESLDAVLVRADFVLITTPLTPETRNLIDRRRLDLMKPTAGLINLSRAAVVDYEALAAKLRDGSLAGAILDVFNPEPLPPNSPYWNVPNLIATPHVSSDDVKSYAPLTLNLFFDNAARRLEGRPFRNRVRPRLGY